MLFGFKLPKVTLGAVRDTARRVIGAVRHGKEQYDKYKGMADKALNSTAGQAITRGVEKLLNATPTGQRALELAQKGADALRTVDAHANKVVDKMGEVERRLGLTPAEQAKQLGHAGQESAVADNPTPIENLQTAMA